MDRNTQTGTAGSQPTPQKPERASLLRRLLNGLWKLRGELLSVLLSLLGAALLGLSFQATASDMTVVTGYGWQDKTAQGAGASYAPFVALCAGDNLVAQTFKTKGGNTNMIGACPTGDIARPVAAVTWESRAFFLWGWLIVLLGAIWQIVVLLRKPQVLIVGDPLL